MFLFKEKREWDKKNLFPYCKISLFAKLIWHFFTVKIYHKMQGSPGQNITGILKVNSGEPHIS